MTISHVIGGRQPGCSWLVPLLTLAGVVTTRDRPQDCPQNRAPLAAPSLTLGCRVRMCGGPPR